MSENPFEVTKAVDFTDDQIKRNFVTFAASDAYSIVDPRSAMPQFLVGGKGGGRTHLMRYFAYPLQKMRASEPANARSILGQVQNEEYLGIYFRCSGLNGSRFEEKHQTVDTWKSVFAFYMDLWLCEQLLVVLSDMQDAEHCWSSGEEQRFSTSVISLLNTGPTSTEGTSDVASIRAVLDHILQLRLKMDRAINNAALTRRLDVNILSNPGALLFGSCQSAAAALPGLEQLRFTFLIDEFENLSEDQQLYFNTLLREKELPTSFLIGGREWGVRTHETLSGGEENKQGSEYEWIVLEDRYRTGASSYADFCRDMVGSRLRDAGFIRNADSPVELIFGTSKADRFSDQALLSVVGTGAPTDRSHISKLRKVVLQATQDKTLTDAICEQMIFAEHPLLEKLAVLKFYKQWSEYKALTLESAKDARSFIEPLLTGNESKELTNFLNLWKSDMIAQIYWENDRRQPYLGFNQFIDMSGFLPRSLLMVLKYVTHWSLFFGERPFTTGNPISQEAQIAGVRDAARWFLADAKPLGQEGEDCDRAIRRLGALLRAVRHSDKPTEVSVTSFSTNFQKIEPAVAKLIQACVDHRLLIEVAEGRSARNYGSIHRKFQLHPMLAPLFGLSTGRRGELSLKPDEVTAIFDPQTEESEYSRIAKARIAGMEAPFSISSTQETLFELN